ncbi:MAG TPA: hypothetical protein VML54_06890 [Candidatus Limnocylindrales bacterium]|nr:hypothetical protein [Candidatus Limnocylindrales bacterium]
MDARGARHLKARLAAGAAIGERVQVVSVAGGRTRLAAGERGTIVSIDEDGIRLLLETGVEVVVDPNSTVLRRSG